MNDFHITKAVKITPIKTVVYTVVIKKDWHNGSPILDVLARISMIQHGIVEKREATHVIVHHRWVKLHI